MEKINRYNYVHGWYSYYLLDERAHNLAFLHLWDALTSSSSIYYYKPIQKDFIDKLEFELNILNKTNSTILIEWKIKIQDEVYVMWVFNFVKIKK